MVAKSFNTPKGRSKHNRRYWCVGRGVNKPTTFVFMAASLEIQYLRVLSTRQLPAHPVSVPIFRPRTTQKYYFTLRKTKQTL